MRLTKQDREDLKHLKQARKALVDIDIYVDNQNREEIKAKIANESENLNEIYMKYRDTISDMATPREALERKYNKCRYDFFKSNFTKKILSENIKKTLIADLKNYNNNFTVYTRDIIDSTIEEISVYVSKDFMNDEHFYHFFLIDDIKEILKEEKNGYLKGYRIDVEPYESNNRKIIITKTDEYEEEGL